MSPRRDTYSLAALTVIELSPPEMVSAAAQAGYDHVGLRLIPATPEDRVYPVIGDTPMVRDIQRRLQDGGITVLDVEVFRLKPDTRVRDFAPAIETAAALGARHLLTAGQDADIARLADMFAEFCAMAGPFDMTADLEFMPWTEISTLESAMAVLKAADCTNAGLLVDALHFDRTRTRLQDLAQVPAAYLHFMQLCDAPKEAPATIEGLIRQARGARLFPGDGELALVDLLRTLPRHLPVSIEVPLAQPDAGMPAVTRARNALAAARRVVAKARSNVTVQAGANG